MSKLVKGTNERVLQLIKKQKREKDQAEVDETFKPLPSVLPLEDLPSVVLGIANLDFNSLKQKEKEVLRTYEFKISPDDSISGMIIVYMNKKADLILYSYKGITNLDEIEVVRKKYLSDDSPLSVAKADLLPKSDRDDSLALYYRACKNAKYQEILRLLFDYYKWVFNTFIANEGEKESEDKVMIEPAVFGRVGDYLNNSIPA